MEGRNIMMGYLNREDKTSEDIGNFFSVLDVNMALIYPIKFQIKMVFCIVGT